MEIYDAIIRAAAAKLQRVLADAIAESRTSEVAVWAIHTTAERNGYFHIGYDYPADVPIGGLTIIRPLYGSWGSIPFSALERELHAAARRAPILPIHPEPAS